jgi:hypothetical protein
MNTKRYTVLLVGVLSLLTVVLGCNRVVVRSRDVLMTPLVKNLKADYRTVFNASRTVLENMEYKIQYVNEDEGTLKTGWMSTTIDSHYVEVFDRPDYGVTNAYYHLAIGIQSVGEGTRISVSAPLRTVVGNMHSSHVIEKKFLSKLADLLRPADIEITNVGVSKD